MKYEGNLDYSSDPVFLGLLPNVNHHYSTWPGHHTRQALV